MLTRHVISISLMASLAMAAETSYGQIKATKATSAEALERIQKQRDLVAAGKQAQGELNVAGLRVGASGRPEWIDAKVIQVIDANQMLVGIEDARTGNGRYTTWIMVKCPTAGITDGRFWRGGEWEKVTGSEVLKVTGTTTYKTTGGGTKTMFVLEAASPKPLPVEKTPSAGKTPPVSDSAAKLGAAAYDDFIDPMRELLLKDWQKEIATLHRVIPEEEQNIKKAKTAKDREYHERWLATYRERLATMERNNPPYINLDAFKKKK